MSEQKRINKTKEELKQELKLKQQINIEEKYAHMIFPILQKQETIYDAQTLLHGLSGYILHHYEKQAEEIKVANLPVDLSQEKEGAMKEGFAEILEMVKEENAEKIAAFLKRYGDTLGYYGAKKYLENPTSALVEEDLIKRPKVV